MKKVLSLVLALALVLGCIAVYLVMFGTGKLIFEEWLPGIGFVAAALVFAVLLVLVWKPRRTA